MTDRISTGAAPGGADVLVQGNHERSWHVRRRPGALAGAGVLLVAAVLAGVALARHDRPEPRNSAQGTAEAEVLRLSLDSLFERRRSGSSPGGLHVQLRNDGAAPVRLLSGRTAGGWRLEVRRPTTLAPGASVVLALSPSPTCSVLAEMRSSGRTLLVEAVVGSGRRQAVVVDLTAAPANGGQFDRGLRPTYLDCAPGRPDAGALARP